MANVIKLTFNPFQENTYILYDDSKECIIIDPGCFNKEEENLLTTTIEAQGLKPVRLINTHCHIDHVFGNRFVSDKYNLPLEIHEGELFVLDTAPQSAALFGLPIPKEGFKPELGPFLKEGDQIKFGNTTLDILFTPGHSPASVSFFCKEVRFLIAGDVLFYGSIGRTDLPGGDFNTLINSINTQFLPLGDDVIVYPGHGPETNIGYERQHNPYL
jgi:hydroxyacylglutathione hydrolase